MVFELIGVGKLAGEGRQEKWKMYLYSKIWLLKFVKKIMAGALKYIIDDTGYKTSVLVPVKTWEELNNKYKKLQNKIDVFNSINQGLSEIKQAKKSGKKLQSLNDFLSESNS